MKPLDQREYLEETPWFEAPLIVCFVFSMLVGTWGLGDMMVDRLGDLRWPYRDRLLAVYGMCLGVSVLFVFLAALQFMWRAGGFRRMIGRAFLWYGICLFIFALLGMTIELYDRFGDTREGLFIAFGWAALLIMGMYFSRRVYFSRGRVQRRRILKGRCPGCGWGLWPGAFFCPACGGEVARKCPNCMGPVRLADRYCPSCGRPSF